MRQYTSKNYPVWCFVPMQVYHVYGDRSWNFLNPNLLFAVDTISKFYGKKILINNWRDGGQLSDRGYRSPNCVIGAYESPHKRGCAIDFNVPDIAPAQVQIDLQNNYELWPEITRMESIEKTKTWTHIDCCNMPVEQKGIYVFKP